MPEGELLARFDCPEPNCPGDVEVKLARHNHAGGGWEAQCEEFCGSGLTPHELIEEQKNKLSLKALHLVDPDIPNPT
jgi:hypothetical protein